MSNFIIIFKCLKIDRFGFGFELFALGAAFGSVAS
jgi:hypothetical protein